jgi:hypothetical protein
MFIVGLDVHKVHTPACILREDGEVRESRLSTTRDQFETVFGSMEKSRILLESSTESEWVARCLEELVWRARPESIARPTGSPTDNETREPPSMSGRLSCEAEPAS